MLRKNDDYAKILYDILDVVEEELFCSPAARDGRSVIFQGYELTRDDFVKLHKVAHRIENLYFKQRQNTKKYRVKNKSWHSKYVLMKHYVDKKVKTPEDYAKIEQLQKEIDEIKEYNKKKKETFMQDKTNFIFNRGE